MLSALEDRAKLVDFDPAQMTAAWEYEYMRPSRGLPDRHRLSLQ